MNEEKSQEPTDWQEARRLRAWELKQKGWRQTDIAKALGVSNGAVSQWIAKARKTGCKALQSRRGGGPKKRLKDAQRKQLPALLEKGAQHFGFKDDKWTYSRVASLIEQKFGVSYTPTHVGRILNELGWNRTESAHLNGSHNETE